MIGSRESHPSISVWTSKIVRGIAFAVRLSIVASPEVSKSLLQYAGTILCHSQPQTAEILVRLRFEHPVRKDTKSLQQGGMMKQA